MNLVRGALKRPITVIVVALGVVLAAVLSLQKTPRDILPTLGIPIIYVAQPYGGMSPAQMEGYLTYYYEYHFLYITGIEHVESKSIQGVSLIKLQFHPGIDMSQALAETINYANRARAFMPPGTVPPFIMRFDAGSVPVGDLVFTSRSKTVGQLQDLALNRVRPLFATLPGVSAPPPFGASQRTIVIKVDPAKLQRYNLSPDQVASAIATTNVISPAGNIKLGGRYPMVPSNSVVADIKELESVPLRLATFPTVFLRDVGSVEDATDIPAGYALVDGRRTVYIPVTKRADASTLAVVDSVKNSIPKFQAVLPEDVKVSFEFDQSVYVRRAIRSLVIEGALGAGLTGMMVLLFLGDWRSAAIVVANIPLALLAAVAGLGASRQTINVMTLGGLALAVGILVDEATVTIENIHAHRARGAPPRRAALDATQETVLPRLLAMLSVLAVFVPSFFMTGAAKALFVPLSLAVGFSMIASYFLSSTFVPVVAIWTLGEGGHAGPLDCALARAKKSYGALLEACLPRRGLIVAAYLLTTVGLATMLFSRLGREIFPNVETDQLQIRLRAPAGLAIDETEKLALKALQTIAKEAGAAPRISVGFVGVQPPNFPINTIYLWTAGPEEAVFQIALKEKPKGGVEAFEERLRGRLGRELPGVRVSFEPSDIVGRVMSQGSATPVEVAVSGPNFANDLSFAQKVAETLGRVETLRDVQIQQAADYPAVRVEIDRAKAGIMGLTVAKIGGALTAATSSSRYGVPVYWADPKSGIAYQVQVEVPQDKMTSPAQVGRIPVAVNSGAVPLERFARVSSTTTIGEYDRYNMQRMATITANVYGEDLGRAAKRVETALKGLEDEKPKGVTVTVRGQIKPMEEMFGGLKVGLALAVAAIFLLLGANFQSLRVAMIVLVAVPAALAGSAALLWATGTTLNVESFMGAIMAIGVAIANAVLLVSFAEEARKSGRPAVQAAVEAATGRLRPILMTTAAMVAGMIPMALGLGESGRQTAPLGRAVAGGLSIATLATLLILPLAYAAFQTAKPGETASLEPEEDREPVEASR